MTVTVEEVITPADIAASASSSFAIATSLLSTDLVLVIMSKGPSGGHTITINGTTPTLYSNWQNGTSGTRFYAYTKTGITGSHSVTYTTASTTPLTQYTVLVVRGLTNPAVTAAATSDLSNTGTAANTDEGPASLSAGTGQLAVFLGTTTSGTITFPSNPTPSSGWATDRAMTTGAGGAHGLAHYIPSSSVSVQANMRTNTFTPIATLMMIVGDVVSLPPLTSTFVGWGNPIF